jgi:hypothetical protein
LRLTVSQSVILGVETHLVLMTRYLLLFDSYSLVFVGRPIWREDGPVFSYMLLSLASAVFFGSESLGIRDHILLSQIWDFLFRRLLRLAGSRWRCWSWSFITSSRTLLCNEPSVVLSSPGKRVCRLGCSYATAHCYCVSMEVPLRIHGMRQYCNRCMMNGPISWTRNWEQWNHCFRYGSYSSITMETVMLTLLTLYDVLNFTEWTTVTGPKYPGILITFNINIIFSPFDSFIWPIIIWHINLISYLLDFKFGFTQE